MRQVTIADADAVIKHIRTEVEYRIRHLDERIQTFLRNTLIDVQYDITIRLNKGEFCRSACPTGTEKETS